MSVKGAIDAVKASRVAKVAGGVGKFVGKSNIYTMIATILVSEVIARMMNDSGGDPEKAVDQILAAGQQKAQVEAVMKTSQAGEERDAVSEHYRGLKPDRMLSKLALQQRSGSSRDLMVNDMPVLQYVTKKLGITPDDLNNLSSPARAGDFTEMQTVLPVSERTP